MNNFENFNKANIRIFLPKILGFSNIIFFLALKLGDNLICYGTLCTTNNIELILINILFIGVNAILLTVFGHFV